MVRQGINWYYYYCCYIENAWALMMTGKGYGAIGSSLLD